MTQMGRVLLALQQHADGTGHVAGTFNDIKDWIGADAANWDIHLLLIQLHQDGAFRTDPYLTPIGNFSVDLA